MWNFSLGTTVSLLARTWPFLALRFVVFGGIAILFLAVTGSGALIGYGVGSGFYDEASGYQFGIYGTIGGFVLSGLIFRLIRQYILYMVKAAHIAVMMKLIDGDPLPEGTGQVAYGRQVVTERFAEANVLFALDLLIKGVVKTIGKIISGVGAFIPIPGLQQIIGIINAVIETSVTFVDEIILAYNVRNDSENPWQSSRHALVLYAQNGKTMIKNAAWLTFFLFAISVLIFLILVGPLAAMFAATPGTNIAYGIIAAVVFAIFVKETLIEPFAVAALMQVYFETIEGQVPDPEWDAKLAGMSSKFRELKDRAIGNQVWSS
ncbi:MAG: hypothetical protein AB3N20_08195 [Rhizobiaceae bacterium]